MRGISIKQRLSSVLLALIVLISVIPFTVTAKVAPPKVLGAPAHFGVTFNYGSFILFVSAPDEIRTYMAQRVQNDPDNTDLLSLSLYYQVDTKINNGSWQYTSAWDSPKTVPKNQKKMYSVVCRDGEHYTSSSYAYFSHLFSDESIVKTITENGWDYFTNNSITFRVRFAQSFDNEKTYVLSPWSKEFVLSANVKVDPNKMINFAPVLTDAEVEMRSDTPYLAVKLEKPHQNIGDLNVVTGGAVRVEIWLRKKGDKDFKQVHYWWVSNETINFNAEPYFEDYRDSYEEAAFEIKTRYSLDLRKYKQAGIDSTSSSVDIYSPFSNVISQNMPAWGSTSGWAEGEVKKSVENGLYPDRFKDADLTKPITRAEFASVALKLYEALSRKTVSPAPNTTFTDTKDTDVLKAYAADIVVGVGNNKYAPDQFISREQCAAMLTRVYKKVNWEGWTIKEDATYTKHSLDYKGVAPFADDANIFPNFKPSVYFMAKYKIIQVTNNLFVPKNTPTAEDAKNYTNATREQALLFSNRTFEKSDEIVDGGPVEQDITKTPPAGQPSTPQVESGAIVGNWSNGMTGVRYNTGTGSFDFGAYGSREEYQFNSDGTFAELISTGLGSEIVIKGKYAVKDGKIIFSSQTSKVSSDYGKTWKDGNSPADETRYFTLEKGDDANYLIIGLEDATLPLDTETNAVRYWFMQN